MCFFYHLNNSYTCMCFVVTLELIFSENERSFKAYKYQPKIVAFLPKISANLEILQSILQKHLHPGPLFGFVLCLSSCFVFPFFCNYLENHLLVRDDSFTTMIITFCIEVDFIFF